MPKKSCKRCKGKHKIRLGKNLVNCPVCQRSKTNTMTQKQLDRREAKIRAIKVEAKRLRAEYAARPKQNYFEKWRPRKRRPRKNIEEGFRDSRGIFHPIRAASDYDPVRGEAYQSRAAYSSAPKRKYRKNIEARGPKKGGFLRNFGYQKFETAYSAEEARNYARDARAQGYSVKIEKKKTNGYPPYAWTIWVKEVKKNKRSAQSRIKFKLKKYFHKTLRKHAVRAKGAGESASRRYHDYKAKGWIANSRRKGDWRFAGWRFVGGTYLDAVAKEEKRLAKEKKQLAKEKKKNPSLLRRNPNALKKIYDRVIKIVTDRGTLYPRSKVSVYGDARNRKRAVFSTGPGGFYSSNPGSKDFEGARVKAFYGSGNKSKGVKASDSWIHKFSSRPRLSQTQSGKLTILGSKNIWTEKD